MKEDYLWDKSGHDPEIEKLEAALKEFRSKNTASLQLPAREFVFEERKTSVFSKRFFRFVLAPAATSIFLLIFSIGVFRALETERFEERAQTDFGMVSDSFDSQKTGTDAGTREESFDETDLEKTNFVMPEPKKSDYKASPKNKRKIFKSKKKFTKFSRREALAEKREPIKTKGNSFEEKLEPIEKSDSIEKTAGTEKFELTAEEKYAYAQLMKALAITSSKLKIVRDKVDGVEPVAAADGK